MFPCLLTEHLTEFATKKRIAVHLELAGLLFNPGASKRITGRPDLHVDRFVAIKKTPNINFLIIPERLDSA
jgi:hypothetical protein